MSKIDVLFSDESLADYQYWAKNDPKKFEKIGELIKSISRDGVLKGIGKPERLKGNYTGWYSRRIDREHRLVYKITDGNLKILTCRYHY
ncbi:Txe/YoeB family addiction module toxin [Staphylococcus warneri]|uniref:Txe/YoeB family addiction module toxin n=1 Tax=Staphylococcus warneri TaxID=1292 RepID=UPI00214CDA7C|nr:Txe/YoeB family addiction module toxin [Staphylococcus warneri]MCR1798259.1 Txe/YoeB family addiction module toxin [Staphylococcus warneri]